MVQLASFLLLAICSLSYAAPVQEDPSQGLSARADKAGGDKAAAPAAGAAAAHVPVKEGPTVAEIIQEKSVTDAFQVAWAESFNTPTTAQEMGGWIYLHKSKPFPLYWVRRAPKDRSKPLNQLKPAEGVTAGINLWNPDNAPGGAPPDGHPPDYHLVATFHTHPMGAAYGDKAAFPSSADLTNAFERGVPGIVINRGGLIAYGPTHREAMTGPQGYPPAVEKYSGQGQGKKISSWRPTKAANQQED